MEGIPKIMSQDEIKSLVQKSYFYSGLVFKHGKVITPVELCTIHNPRFNLVLFEEPGNNVFFNSIIGYLNDVKVKEEMDFCIMSGISSYKKSDIYIDKESRQKVLEILKTFPNMKVFTKFFPPVNMTLKSGKNEYLTGSLNEEYLKYNYLPLEVSSQISMNVIKNLQSSSAKSYVEMIRSFFAKLYFIIFRLNVTTIDHPDLQYYIELKNNTKKEIEEMGFSSFRYNIVPSYGNSLDVYEDKTKNLFIQFYVKIPNIYKFTLRIPELTEIHVQNAIHPEEDVIIMNMGMYNLPNLQKTYNLDDTTLQQVIDKYEYSKDILYVIACRSYEEGDYKDLEYKGSRELLQKPITYIPVKKEGKKRRFTMKK